MLQPSGPLAGVRVLEMEGIGPAPFTCMLLADLGADVLRIARPARNDPAAAHRGHGKYVVVHRGRPALELDLKSDSGRKRALELAAHSDVLVEGFRPGVMERLGLGPRDCQEGNPALIYGRMTGWGQDGPLAKTAGHDINYIALTGALHAIGTGASPIPPLNLVGDFGGGALYLAFGIVSALLEARTTGRGQVIDAAIVDGTLSLMAMVFGRWAAGLWQDARASNLLDGGTPWYRTYETADGGHIAVGAIEPQFWDALRERLAPVELPDSRQRLDRACWPALSAQLQETFRMRTRNAWEQLFAGSDACVTPVLSLAEAGSHPHNVARRNLQTIDGVPQPGIAPRLSAPRSTNGLLGETGDERAFRWLLRGHPSA